MSLPSLTAASSLRAPEARAGRARPQARGLVPAEPFCVQAQFYDGDQPIGRPGFAEARHIQDVSPARAQARQRALQANPQLRESNTISIRLHTFDRATRPLDYQRCSQAARAANIHELF